MNDSSRISSANQHVAEAMNAAMRRHKSQERALAQSPVAVGPGGRLVDATPYLRNLHNAEIHVSVFAQVDKYPERYLKDPQPGWRYLFIDPKDSVAAGRVRSKQYKEVLIDDLLDETDLPFSDGPQVKQLRPTHKGPDKGVYLYDLQLVCCSPEVYNRLFTIREAMGMAKITSGVDKLKDQAQSFGGVDVEFEATMKGN